MIVVFGSINIDLITPVPKLPTRGETVIGDSYTLVQGGKGANQALAAAQGAAKGQRVAMLGTIGPDAWGKVALKRLRDAGVDLSLVSKGKIHTACGFISVDDKGQTLITVSPGANMETRATLIDKLPAPLGPKDWLMLQMEVKLEENWRALAKAKKAGAKRVLNLAPAMPIDERVLDNLDLLIVNQPEAQLIGKVRGVSGNHLAIARALAADHNLTCIATLGDKGSVAIEPNGKGWRVARLSVDVVDTTGAGDAYVGYLVSALDRGEPLQEAMRFASAGASLSCETRGAQTAYLPRTKIEKRARELPPAEQIAA
jgi:ribokinase